MQPHRQQLLHHQEQDQGAPARSSYQGDYNAGAPPQRLRPVRPADQLISLGNEVPTNTAKTTTLANKEAAASSTVATNGDVIGSGRRQPIRPTGELQLLTGPFTGSSVSRQDFAVSTSGQPQSRQAAVRRVGELTATASLAGGGAYDVGGAPVAMVSTTTSRDAFTAKQREGPPPRRRQQQQQPSD